MIDRKPKTVSVGKTELKNLLREVVKEMAQSGELSTLLTESASINGIPVTIPNQTPTRQQPVDPRISAFAAAAAKNPTQQQMLEGIFSDTLANTVPAQQYGENMAGQSGMYGGGMNYPQMQMAAPQYPLQTQQMQPLQQVQPPMGIGYIGEPDQSGFVGYQPPTNTQIQQASNMHPMARMAFKHPLKNRLE